MQNLTISPFGQSLAFSSVLFPPLIHYKNFIPGLIINSSLLGWHNVQVSTSFATTNPSSSTFKKVPIHPLFINIL